MCSIIASFNVDKVKELIELNRYRGEFSHSITYIDTNDKCKIIHMERGLGPIESKDINPPNRMENVYIIVHQQAPTAETNETCIHPAEFMNINLWHNGILKQGTVDRLLLDDKSYFGDKWNWDTQLLARELYHWHVPNNIDGSFACLMHRGKHLYAFRNEISPLFMDNDYTFSSTKFDRSYPLMPNHMFMLDLKGMTMTADGTFNTVDNPFNDIA